MTGQSTIPHSVNEPLSTFEHFLLTEYNNIAHAHFNTKSAIATFFKHYLLIVSLPISVFLVIGREPVNVKHIYVQFIINLLPIIFFIICFIGYLVMLYIINLDCDAMLYARTVNGIRHYFYEISNIHKNLLNNIITLPIDINKPKYSIFGSIFFIALTFSVINTLYFIIGLCVSCEYGCCMTKSIYISSFGVFIIHIVSAIIYIGYLENKHKLLRKI